MIDPTAIVLMAGVLLAGVVIARSANTVTGETTQENEGRNLSVALLFFVVAAIGGLMVFGLGGCISAAILVARR